MTRRADEGQQKRVLGLAALASWLACHAPPEPTAGAPRPQPTVVAIPAPAASATASGTASDTDSLADGDTATSVAAAGAAPPGGPHRIVVPLRPDADWCTLVLEASYFADEDDTFAAGGIRRLATDESPGCAAAVLFDAGTEPDPDGLGTALEGGIFQRPGRPASAAAAEQPNHLEDLSFDGYLDMCIVAMMGAYNYSQRCWVFDPKTRGFVRNAELANLLFLTVDPKARTLKSGHRAGGPAYASAEHGWIGGQLVPLRTETTYLGERPDGSPLPPGYDSYAVRHERRGGRLVKVFEGPRR